jgi:hypothetical protein
VKSRHDKNYEPHGSDEHPEHGKLREDENNNWEVKASAPLDEKRLQREQDCTSCDPKPKPSSRIGASFAPAREQKLLETGSLPECNQHKSKPRDASDSR